MGQNGQNDFNESPLRYPTIPRPSKRDLDYSPEDSYGKRYKYDIDINQLNNENIKSLLIENERLKHENELLKQKVKSLEENSNSRLKLQINPTNGFQESLPKLVKDFIGLALPLLNSDGDQTDHSNVNNDTEDVDDDMKLLQDYSDYDVHNVSEHFMRSHAINIKEEFNNEESGDSVSDENIQDNELIVPENDILAS